MDIYLYSEIGFWGVTAQDILSQLKGVSKDEPVTVHINSPGGEVYEGVAIANILAGYNTEAVIEGLCASIATVIAVSCKTVKMFDNATFMIHNPFIGLQGDAEELQKAVDHLKSLETNLVQAYITKTGKDEATIREMMKSETFLSANQAKEFGFIDEVIKPQFKAVSYMKTKEVLDNESKSLLDRLKAFFNAEPMPAPIPAKNETKKKLATGQEITLSGAEGDNLVGQTVTLTDEAGTVVPAPDGEHTLEDGQVITVSGGVITEVETAEAMEKKKLMQAMEEYKQQLAALTAENASLKDGLSQVSAKLTEYASLPISTPAPMATEPPKPDRSGTKEDVVLALKENAKTLSNKKN
jgi:ATP-dependent Clp endopeptidase proteolytic subunit ClpP